MRPEVARVIVDCPSPCISKGENVWQRGAFPKSNSECYKNARSQPASQPVNQSSEGYALIATIPV